MFVEYDNLELCVPCCYLSYAMALVFIVLKSGSAHNKIRMQCIYRFVMLNV